MGSAAHHQTTRRMLTNPVTSRPWHVATVTVPGALGAFPPLIQRLLAARGFDNEVQARSFLSGPSGARPDPLLLPDIELAIQRIRAAIAAEEPIAIYGDFDVDGITATAMLTEGLREVGARVIPYIPNRFREGYGVNAAALTHLREAGARLVITVDCGISAATELRAAQAIGLDAIVLDHHEVPASGMPVAVAVIDPKRADASYPTRELCSGGLALRLLEALYAAVGRPLDLSRYLDLAALATVCDMVPLQGENRAIVQAGLPAIAATRRPGLQALLRVSGAAGETPTADLLGFRIGPRINAAGRLDDAADALEILMTRDPLRASVLAERLDMLNRRRQEMVESATLVAAELAAREPADAPVLLVGDARISRGIVGLIATRLVELYQRPAFVYEQDGERCIGSARGVTGFDVVGALGNAADLLHRHGGHRAAGGFALSANDLEAFRERLLKAAATQLAGRQPSNAIEVEAEASLQELTSATLRHLWRFAPCGTGNPNPLLLSRRVRVVDRRVVGSGKHLQLRLRDGATWRAIAFGRAGQTAPLGSTLDIVYAIDAGRGEYGPSLRILDLALSKTREVVA
jgi:single-stranded-DNA-specific exonuclease